VFYAKNLPMLERALRITLGLGLIFLGMFYFQAGVRSPAGMLSAGSGLVSVATGFLGFCPACAMLGRKLDKPARTRGG